MALLIATGTGRSPRTIRQAAVFLATVEATFGPPAGCPGFLQELAKPGVPAFPNDGAEPERSSIEAALERSAIGTPVS